MRLELSDGERALLGALLEDSIREDTPEPLDRYDALLEQLGMTPVCRTCARTFPKGAKHDAERCAKEAREAYRLHREGL